MEGTELPPVTGLRADIVPHREWAVRRWFYANPIWYYHRRSAEHEICADGKFYQLVDPQLREVCRLLNDAGVRTTPSCEGHSYPRQRFERIWEELTAEAEKVRGPGLVVRDCENERPYLFREPGYAVPWPSFDEFYREAGAHQGVGYLGIIIPSDLAPLARLLREESGNPSGRSATAGAVTKVRPEEDMGVILGGTILSIRVEAEDPHQRGAAWGRFTIRVREVLESNPQLRAPPIGACDASAELQASTIAGLR
jgi:hypothetical protein